MYNVFVYGTLLRDQPNHRYLEDAIFIGPAKVVGELYSLGGFPGLLIPNPDEPPEEARKWNGAFVKGEVYQVYDFKQMDGLEGYHGEKYRDRNHYNREPVLAFLDATNEPIHAQVYVYNRPVTGLQRVPHGDWVKWVTEKNVYGGRRRG